MTSSMADQRKNMVDTSGNRRPASSQLDVVTTALEWQWKWLLGHIGGGITQSLGTHNHVNYTNVVLAHIVT